MRIEIQVASVPDRAELVAELWIGNSQLAELFRENGALHVEFCGHTGVIPFDEVMRALDAARSELTEPDAPGRADATRVIEFSIMPENGSQTLT